MSEAASNSDIVKTFEDLESQANAEHVSMDSGDSSSNSAETTAAVDLKNASASFELSNLMHGTRFCYELYDEGYLKVRMWKNKVLEQDFYLALRFMNPVTKVTKLVARRSMYVAAGMLSAGVVTAVLDAISPYDQFFRSSTILLACGSAIAFMLFLYWSHERTDFYSATGDCAVLKLMGSVESFRSCRVIAPKIASAINDAQSQNVADYNVYLREEMHDHYRLQRAGAITPEACSEATKTILGKFG